MASDECRNRREVATAIAFTARFIAANGNDGEEENRCASKRDFGRVLRLVLRVCHNPTC